jgi:methionine-rich copper-binding protein CopC
VEISPDVVDAGAELSLEATVACSPARDMRGRTLFIKDHAGADVCRIELTEFDGAINRTREFLAKAPVRPGEYTWMAVFPEVENEGISYSQASTQISFKVKPHSTHIVAWDTPPAVVVGERFRMKVGMKCSDECDLERRDFTIYDHEGKQVATSNVAGDRWPSTGLHVAEVELQAPAREGLYTWSVRSIGSDTAIPHDEGSVSFGIRVVCQPDCRVRVEAIDQASQAPLSGARVVMHPYQAVTDERGVAEVQVAKGAYRLFVTQTDYLTFGVPVEVTEDMTVRAELELEPVPERN